MKEKIIELSSRLEKIGNKINSEESTKQSLVLPFIQALGYDIFNPEEVTPEVHCDLANKGDKVDYVIFIKGKESILVECKNLGSNLNHHLGQLSKYYAASPAKFAILTDGNKYLFFSDIEKSNLMDKDPFYSLDLSNLKDIDAGFLTLFTRDDFNEDKLKEKAYEELITKKLKESLYNFLEFPSDKWIRQLASTFTKEQLSTSKINIFRKIIKDTLPKAVKEIYSQDTTNEYEDYSKGDFTKDEIEILDTINGFLITVPELNGHIMIDKISDGIIRVNYENQYWNICRIKWGTRTKFLFLCKNSHAGEGTKYKINSLNEVVELKDKIIETALETRLYCLNWRETHS